MHIHIVNSHFQLIDEMDFCLHFLLFFFRCCVQVIRDENLCVFKKIHDESLESAMNLAL